MAKVSLWKKIKLYRLYRKIIKKNYDVLTDRNYNLRIDRVNRVYTVVNLPDEVRTYGTSLSQKYIQDYINEVDKLFLNMGLSELIGIIDIQQLDDTNYLIVFGFSFLDTAKMANRLLIWTSIIGILTALWFIFF